MPPPSARRRPLRRVLFAALRLAVVAVAAALLLAVVFGSRTIESLDEGAKFARGSLGAALKNEHGVVFCCDMDGRRPCDLVTGMPLAGWGSQAVPGVFGQARRFEARSGEAS